jgi:hypothetical protein
LDGSSLPIINCDLKFRFVFPNQWGQLVVTSDTAVRFCSMCKKNVYYCLSIEDARLQTKEGDCVAIDDFISDEIVEGADRNPDVDTMLMGFMEE